jgi:glycosyltransferase involved in cell wall biosynthesis
MAASRPPVALVLDPGHGGRSATDWELAPADLRALLRSGKLLRHVGRHPSARLLVDDIDGLSPPKAILASRLFTTGPARIEDRAGRTVDLDAGALLRLVGAWARDLARAPQVLKEARRAVAALEAARRQPRTTPRFDRSAGVLFLRTDLCRRMTAGGSLAHLAGVLNELQHLCGGVDLLTSDPIPLLDPAIRPHVVKPERRTWGNAELHRFNLNRPLAEAAARLARPGRLIYQRYSIENWTGAALSRRAGLPFILEYNGSEIWVARNWGSPLRYEDLAARIELANLRAADLVTVVSEPLRQELLARGIPDERILMNPNGVDPERFAPNDGGDRVRARHGLGGRLVIGFIGTFGPWHGVEVLAEAFATLLERRADLRERVRLLLIGDGERLPAVRDILARHQRLPETVMTGLVPQADGPEHLAACNILVVPTVPNADGTPFFGSPTKLFECMAVGRAIAATPVGQVADILDDGRTALLTPPSDADALARALERLVDDPALRASLGQAARAAVLQKHTWRQHVARVLERFEGLSM